jgi:hypothetical protein
MKKLVILLVLFVGMLSLSSCKGEHGKGPIFVEASYPGEFKLIVGMYNDDAVVEERITPNPSGSYSGWFYDNLVLWQIGVRAEKIAPDDFGLLEVTVTGSFGVLHDSRPDGDTRAILLTREWDRF